MGASLSISQVNINTSRIFLAGWTMRRFSQKDFLLYVGEVKPPLVELSKDFLRDEISIKNLGHELDRLKSISSFDISYAGTTDFVNCAGMKWERYRLYLAIQVAQAKFLESSIFRAFVGKPCINADHVDIIDRLNAFCEEIKPLDLAIEIHGGVECDLMFLKLILNETPAKIVVDFENMLNVGLSTENIFSLIPLDRIAYIHQRNLPKLWIEHNESLPDEVEWRRLLPGAVFLWEPKKLNEPAAIKELYFEYRAAN